MNIYEVEYTVGARRFVKVVEADYFGTDGPVARFYHKRTEGTRHEECVACFRDWVRIEKKAVVETGRRDG